MICPSHRLGIVALRTLAWSMMRLSRGAFASGRNDSTVDFFCPPLLHALLDSPGCCSLPLQTFLGFLQRSVRPPSPR